MQVCDSYSNVLQRSKEHTRILVRKRIRVNKQSKVNSYIFKEVLVRVILSQIENLETDAIY